MRISIPRRTKKPLALVEWNTIAPSDQMMFSIQLKKRSNNTAGWSVFWKPPSIVYWGISTAPAYSYIKLPVQKYLVNGDPASTKVRLGEWFIKFSSKLELMCFKKMQTHCKECWCHCLNCLKAALVRCRDYWSHACISLYIVNMLNFITPCFEEVLWLNTSNMQ